ncbi:sensor histidine kinase [Clostridium chauvoei]|nr:HAMP domain-containing sensor histidine kinase [Clostridium chauvoei]CDG00772.1 Putative Integral membrane sensor signal transduction histidine kinase [Clostridium chauvoei JF4335]ATD54169.1 hypothetical protein BTM20_02545 [Clostridium chauvoei]MBX7281342.1 HAMP domain-containing histidine kinase [Clostridium chauvoei]MBX7283824.1 HAMP domain-containing histidine kinase [Clostridium chauvoei]MBX7288882.1 HAMP domain-containing histidine kinase [Clostridium chauvoei]
MKKITLKMIKYMVILNLVSALLGFSLTWLLLPSVYNNNEFKLLEETSKYVIECIENNEPVSLDNISAVLLKNGEVVNLCKNKNKQIKNIDFFSLETQEIYNSKNGNTYITYKVETPYGDLVIYKGYEATEQLIKSVNTIMVFIFILLLVFSAILAIYVGDKFTDPIIKIQNKAKDIAKGIYSSSYKIEGNDEISDLSSSIEEMAKDLKTKDNLQREFIANVSHDLKTPLSVIRANSEAIRDGIIPEDKVVEYSESIINEVDNLNELVDEMLLLSRLKEDNKFLNLKNQSLKMFLYESFRRLVNANNRIKNVKYKIDTRIDNLEKFNVDIDEKYLFRVISNLFNNALIHSKTKEITLKVETTNLGIKVGVRDFGIGIKEEELKFIWDRYYKGNISGGIGLGLAICKEIIVAHGFIYGVESKVNKGTEFYFTIPYDLIVEV